MDSLKSLLFTLMVGSLAQGMIAQELYEGDAETYLQKAQTLDRGQNFGSEIREAISLYQQAASLGSADAAYQLAMIYIEGRGTPKNPTRGYSLLKKSALAKNADAAVLWAEVLSAEGNYQEARIKFKKVVGTWPTKLELPTPPNNKNQTRGPIQR